MYVVRSALHLAQEMQDGLGSTKNNCIFVFPGYVDGKQKQMEKLESDLFIIKRSGFAHNLAPPGVPPFFPIDGNTNLTHTPPNFCGGWKPFSFLNSKQPSLLFCWPTKRNYILVTILKLLNCN
jgi:hypothetical protein